MSVATLDRRELKAGFGAEILGLDVARADKTDLAGVVDAFQRHGAILLRDQTLNPDDLMRFIATFGEAEGHTLQQFTLSGHPKIYVLSNRSVDGVPIGAHNDGVGWHTDYSYKPEPVMCTMLYAVEVPPEGSDTLLADGCAAWAALEPEKRIKLESLKLHHSYAHFMATREYSRTELSDDIKRENPDVEHPLIRTHPADGRKALWPSTGTVTEVIGMPGARRPRPSRRAGRVHDPGSVRLSSQVARGRSAHVGQSLHPAHRHALRRYQILPDDAPPVGQG